MLVHVACDGGKTPAGGDDDTGDPSLSIPRDDDTDTPPLTRPPDTSTPPTETDDGVPIPPRLSDAALADIRTEIDALLAGLSGAQGVFVVDVENDQQIYAADADVPYKPASNTKLLTTGVALDLLGPDHRFEVAVYSDAPPVGGAVGDLDVVGFHDFSWSTDFYRSAGFPAARLADMLVDAGVQRVTGTLTFRGEAAVDAYHFGTYDAEAHRLEALALVVDALQTAGIALDGPVDVGEGFDPGATWLATRMSLPLATACHPLNVYSNNEMADILARHNGFELWGGSSYDDGEAAVRDWLAGLGLDPGPVNLDDGSGLSHGNRVTARTMVDMQRAMWGRPAGEAWRRTFSIGGVIGTLGGRLHGPDTHGRVFAKTGTLTGVSALSGYVVNRYDGHRFVFGMLMNDTPSAAAARATQDRIVEVLAADHRRLGARPAQPVLAAVRAVGGAIDVRWPAVPGARGYTVWATTDGVWRRAGATWTTAPDTSLADPGGTVWVRVTAHAGALVSDPSDVYAARAGGSPVLVVDGSDRYAEQWENPMGIGHGFVAVTGDALGAAAFDSAANEQVVAGTVDLDAYASVIWVLGEESTDHATFDADEQAAVRAWLDRGGNLLVSGSEIGWDLDLLGDAAGRAFYRESLHARYVDDDAGTWSVAPVPGGLFDGVGELGFLTPGTLEVLFPDVIAPEGGAVVEARYLGGLGGVAAVSYDGDHRVVHLGFPFETLDNAPQRALVMGRILDFFAAP